MTENKGFRKIENNIYQALTAARLTCAGYAVLLAIIGRTLGFRKGSEYKRQAPISLGYFQKATGLSRQSVLKGIKEIEARRIILPPKRRSTKKTIYGLNPNPEEWLPSEKNYHRVNGRNLVSTLHRESAAFYPLTHTDVMLGNQIIPDWATKSHYASEPVEASVTLSKETYIKETLYKEKNDFLSEVHLTNKVTIYTINYYLKQYQALKGKPHPNLKPEQWTRVVAELESFNSDWSLDSRDYKRMIDYHFQRGVKTDYNINHFATEGILMNLFYKKCYY